MVTVAREAGEDRGVACTGHRDFAAGHLESASAASVIELARDQSIYPLHCPIATIVVVADLVVNTASLADYRNVASGCFLFQQHSSLAPVLVVCRRDRVDRVFADIPKRAQTNSIRSFYISSIDKYTHPRISFVSASRCPIGTGTFVDPLARFR